MATYTIKVNLDKEDYEALEAAGYIIPVNVAQFLRDEARICKRKLDKEKAVLMFKRVVTDYTGGGIWLFWGQLRSGEYFLTDDHGATLILNEEPGTDESLFEEWQKAHLIRELDGEELKDFLRSLLEYVGNPRSFTSGTIFTDTNVDKYRKLWEV